MLTRRTFIPGAAVAAAALVVLTAAGCASGQQPVGEYIDDAGTTTRVKTKLIEDDVIRGFQIRIETIGGVARLTGHVRTQAQAQRAEELARATYGVKDVRNEITVGP